MKEKAQRNLAIGNLLMGLGLFVYIWYHITEGSYNDLIISLVFLAVPQSVLGVLLSGILVAFGIVHWFFHLYEVSMRNSLSIMSNIGMVIGITLFFRIRIWSSARMGYEATQAAIPLGIFFISISILLFIINVILSAAGRNKNKTK